MRWTVEDFWFVVMSVFSAIRVCSANEYYTDKWAVHIEGGEDVARRLAEQHGFIYLDRIMQDFYHLQHRKVSKRSLSPSSHLHTHLSLEPEVKWLEQQISRKRVKRDAASTLYNDPKWPRMWYLHRDGGLDMNVVDVYKRWGITGRGVVVSILDDGIEKDHPDLSKNYDPGASYDVNDHDSDPQPRYDFSNENRHGTRCAGEVAAQANNAICSTGVAYDAGIGGVRMLDGDVTDAVEAQSISFNPEHIDIYSASWGPDDDGRTVDGPGPLARKAFYDGIRKGRRNLGSIYVWASGNGGRNGDSCSCDGYTNSIHTLSISSASENGLVPWYSEACASTLASTYSSGGMAERQILTTDLRHSCTEQHTGTSASAPLAAGICALALQANPDLSWRDMQYIVVLTARQANLNADDWVINGIGRKVSHHFGFGLMDAAAMVELAYNWTRLPEQHRCEVISQVPPRNLGPNSVAEFTISTDGCKKSADAVTSLEHVQVMVTLGAMRRGEVQIILTSPSGTQSVVLARRIADTSNEGLSNWMLMTTHCWGERPFGTWTLSVQTGGTAGQLTRWSLILFGTAVVPDQLSEYLSSHAPTTIAPPPTTPMSSAPPEHLKSSSLKSSLSSSLSSTVASAVVIGSTLTGVAVNKTTAVGVIDLDNRNHNTSSHGSLDNQVFTTDHQLHCSPGTYLLNGQCYSHCPLLYYASNMTSSAVGPSSSNVVAVCVRCTSVGSCSGSLARSFLVISIGVVCLALFVVSVGFVLLRVSRQRWRSDGGVGESSTTRFRTPRYHANGHIIIGVHDKPLLGMDSYSSDEEDEVDAEEEADVRPSLPTVIVDKH
jgi:furin